MRIYFLLLLLFPLGLFAQELKKKRQPYTNGDYADYYVLKSDKSVMHGPYVRCEYNKHVLTTGYYNNGLEDSTWEYYTHNTRSLIQKGSFSKGKKIGRWDYYNQDGLVELAYDHTNNTIISCLQSSNMKNHKYRIIKGSDTLLSVLDSPFVYIGSSMYILEMGRRTKLPADDGFTSGKIVVNYTVAKDGTCSNFSLKKGISPALNMRELEILKRLDMKYTPAIVNGEKVVLLMEFASNYTFD